MCQTIPHFVNSVAESLHLHEQMDHEIDLVRSISRRDTSLTTAQENTTARFLLIRRTRDDRT